MTTNLKPRSHCPGVRPGASRQFAAGGPGKPGRIGTEFESVHIFSAVLRTKPRCIPGVDPEVLRCVPVRPDTPRRVTEVGRQSTVAYEYQCNFR